MSKINGFVGRRNFLRIAGAGSIGGLLWGQQPALAAGGTGRTPVNPAVALQRLKDGNSFFVRENISLIAAGNVLSSRSRSRVQETAAHQYPFAAILGCADSRVPSEIIFAQGIGDLFDVRVAGNIASREVIGSLEYAISQLGTQLIVVLGHERCGAVKAVVENTPLPPQINSLVPYIQPAVNSVQGQPGDKLENSVIANVRYQVLTLRASSAILSQAISNRTLDIVGGRYDLDTGAVTWL